MPCPLAAVCALAFRGIDTKCVYRSWGSRLRCLGTLNAPPMQLDVRGNDLDSDATIIQVPEHLRETHSQVLRECVLADAGQQCYPNWDSVLDQYRDRLGQLHVPCLYPANEFGRRRFREIMKSNWCSHRVFWSELRQEFDELRRILQTSSEDASALGLGSAE